MITYKEIEAANKQMKLTPVRGKDYAEVNQRIKAFRMVYPTGFIIPSIESLYDGVITMTAEVGYYDESGNKMILGVGTAYEKEGSSNINKTSYIENCETSAVGRALGMAGFGIDTAVASAEEVKNAIEIQNGTNDILVCSDCGCRVSEKEHDWSVSHFKRVLCRNCQIKVKEQHDR